MAERAVILGKNESLGINDFPVKPREVTTGTNTAPATLISQEMDLIRTSLKKYRYNQKSTAESLGITRDTLIRKMKKYKIQIRKIEE